MADVLIEQTGDYPLMCSADVHICAGRYPEADVDIGHPHLGLMKKTDFHFSLAGSSTYG